MTLPVDTTPSAPASLYPPVQPDRQAELRAVAEDLEASFLSEMLKHAGFGDARSAFGGGAGEDQFASLLRTEHARALAENGGVGLAQSLFEALVAREADVFSETVE